MIQDVINNDTINKPCNGAFNFHPRKSRNIDKVQYKNRNLLLKLKQHSFPVIAKENVMFCLHEPVNREKWLTSLKD